MPVPEETLHAFDRHAADYVATWGTDPLARVFRARVIAACARFFPGGGRILDLGCGPGLDAEVLEALGYDVLAVDASAGMVAEARRRASDVRTADLDVLGTLLPDAPFDGALSNFGAINCVSDLSAFGHGLAALLRPGAHAVLVVINRWCPAEDLALLSRGRRPRRHVAAVQVSGHAVRLRYLAGTDLVRALPRFDVVHREALGALMPPPDLGGRPGRRARVEPWVAGWPLLRDLGDHSLVVLRRRPPEGLAA
ncbi:MAG: class I SAM-dependent methyltransferase [Pseudomonadota bacterium]|nr:class I SAM-dependent methyltransferase [Pseudomonadota bacterium]